MSLYKAIFHDTDTDILARVGRKDVGVSGKSMSVSMSPSWNAGSCARRMLSVWECYFSYPESRLAKMFNGSVPIILDSLKQHYFIDRDGNMFRHVLNFLRTSTLAIPDDFDELDLLLEEARYFELAAMVRALNDYRRRQRAKRAAAAAAGARPAAGAEQNGSAGAGGTGSGSAADERTDVDCVIMNVSPELGERVSLSAERRLLQELFPELAGALADYRSGTTVWTSTADSDQPAAGAHVVRFPLNGFCRLNSLQVIQRLLSAGFDICASAGAGVEGQQFSEYVFRRRRAHLLSLSSSSLAASAAVVVASNAADNSAADDAEQLAPLIKRERLSD